MKNILRARSYDLVPVADTSGDFEDFAPYVASVNNDGVVAFQATLGDGASGVFAGSGGPLTTVAASVIGGFRTIHSHPDITSDGAACFYASLEAGGHGVFLVRDGHVVTVAETHGPLGPTINESGTVAFRVNAHSGASSIVKGDGDSATTVATTGSVFSGFHGLPVINSRGAVAFRADLEEGGQGIYVGDGESVTTVASTGELFGSLGLFPSMNNAGAVAFCATLPAGGSGVFVASGGTIESVVDTSGPFESFRGALLDDHGRLVFYATPKRGELGVFSGADPHTDCLLSIDSSLLGSTVVDFALNPVSINDVGQLAIRVTLADGRQFVLRADPVGP